MGWSGLSLTTVGVGGSGAGVTSPQPLLHYSPMGGPPPPPAQAWLGTPASGGSRLLPSPTPPHPSPSPIPPSSAPLPHPPPLPAHLHTPPTPSPAPFLAPSSLPLPCPFYCPMCSPHSDLLCRLLNSLTGLFHRAEPAPAPPAQPPAFPSWSHTRLPRSNRSRRGATTRVPRRPSPNVSHTEAHIWKCHRHPPLPLTPAVTCPSLEGTWPLLTSAVRAEGKPPPAQG